MTDQVQGKRVLIVDDAPGLAIARAIVVTKHGGALSFESEVGKGTTFTIRLPIGEESHLGGIE